MAELYQLKSRIKDILLEKFSGGRLSYSQSGEDRIVGNLLEILGVKKPMYIDVGSHHPFKGNNTAAFYRSGANGVNIEPNPVYFNSLKKNRPKDINLNIGIGSEERIQSFYVMDPDTLSTFSQEQFEYLKNNGYARLTTTMDIPVKKLDNLISEYCQEAPVHFLNIDAEGWDEEILQSVNFEKNSPWIICCETRQYRKLPELNGSASSAVSDILKNQGYSKYADTNLNSIFIRTDLPLQ